MSGRGLQQHSLTSNADISVAKMDFDAITSSVEEAITLALKREGGARPWCSRSRSPGTVDSRMPWSLLAECRG